MHRQESPARINRQTQEESTLEGTATNEQQSCVPVQAGRMQTARPYVLLFLLLSIVYHSNLRPIASGDSLGASLIPFSVLLDHSIALDRFGSYIRAHSRNRPNVVIRRSGHYYSVYPIAGPLLATPLYLPIAFVPGIRSLPPATLLSIARIVEKIMAVALAAFAAVLLLLLLRRLTSERAAWMLTLVFALGTGNWSTSSQALWQHTYGQIAIVGCLYAIERFSAAGSGSRWYWIAGICAACAVAIRPTNIGLLPALALVLWLRGPRMTRYVQVFGLAAFAGALIAVSNFRVFHSVIGGLRGKLAWPPWDSLPGILMSPGRGLLIYTPIVIFAFAAFSSRARESRQRHRPLVIAASIFSICQIAFIAAWPIWWGGYCWGPRLLTEILIPVIVLIAIGMPAITGPGLRRAFAAAAIYGCLIQALGVYLYPKGQWDSTPVSVDAQTSRLWDWADNPILRTARGGVAWEPYAIVGAGLTGGIPAAAKKLQELGISAY